MSEEMKKTVPSKGVKNVNEKDEKMRSHFKTVSCYANVTSFQLENHLIHVTCPLFNDIIIVNVSGFEKFQDNIYVITVTEEKLNEEIREILTKRTAVKFVNVRGLEEVKDGRYIIVLLNEGRQTSDNHSNLNSKTNVALSSTTVTVADDTVSEKNNYNFKILKIFNIEGLSDGVYFFFAMKKNENVRETSIVEDPTPANTHLQFNTCSMASSRIYEGNLTKNRNTTVTIANISGLGEIPDGHYICISINTSAVVAHECTHNKLKFSVNVKPTSQSQNIKFCDASQGMLDTGYFVYFTGIENIQNGKYLIIPLNEIKQGGESSAMAVNHENQVQGSQEFIENLVQINEEYVPASPENVTVNYQNFMDIFQSISTPDAATKQEIKSQLAQHNFNVSTNLLKKFLFKGTKKNKIRRINGKYQVITPMPQP